MAKKKSVEQMSSDELFELAQERQQQEQEKAKEAIKEQVAALRKEKKAILARHKKELAAIENEIEQLTGRSSGGSRGSVNVSQSVIEILSKHTQLSTKEIQAELTASGIAANNLSQTLAYLKRQGKISSPSRSVYAIA